MLEESLEEFLRTHGCDLRIGVKQYDIKFHNKMVEYGCFVNSELQLASSSWRLVVTKTDLADGSIELRLNATCTGGILADAAFFVEIDINKWHPSNYLLMPAACYNGNRYESRPQKYMPFFYELDHLTPKAKILLSDVPRLSLDESISKIDERTGSVSSPIVSYYDHQNKASFICSVNIKENGVDSGLCFEETKDKCKARLTITNPVVREVFQYNMTNTCHPSGDVPKSFVKGDEVHLTLRLKFGTCNSVQELFKQIEDMPTWWYPDQTAQMHDMAYSKAFSIIENKFNHSNFVEEYGYYSVGLRENAFQDWQLGWTGGLITTLPLFLAGTALTRARVYQNFEWFFEHAIAPSGLFWGIGENGNTFFGEFEKTKPLGKDLLLVRKMADALYYISKQFLIFEEEGIEVKEQWKYKLLIAIERIIEIWEKYGQLGHYLDIHTCEIRVGGSTSGGLMSAALCMASQYFDNQRYLEIAIDIAKYFYQDYVSKGLTYGGVGDAMHNFDSESCYGVLESFALIAEKIQSPDWVQRTEEAAYLMSTWVATYSYEFPEDTLFGRLKMDTKGTVFANTQNKHLSPGICTYSGIALLRHFRSSQNTKWLYLLQKIVRAIPGYLSHRERPIGNMKEGWISERINTTDWWEPIGEIFEGSTWAETSCLLSRVEIPGIYVVKDLRLVIAFDLVEAKWIERELLITNAQAYDLEITMLIEDTESFKSSLPVNVYGNMIVLKVAANTTLTYVIE